MIKRRRFLQIASTLPAVVSSSRSVAGILCPHSAPGRELSLALFNARTSEGQSFAAAMNRFGVATEPAGDDVTPLWYDVLHKQWTECPRPLAGLTRSNTLFCLEQLAWDHRMRVVYWADHSLAMARDHSHETDDPQHARSEASSSKWVDSVARHLLAQQSRIAGGAIDWPRHPGPAGLVSWMIAPVN